jgi:hypothetical protein
MQTVDARAATLLDAWLRGYLARPGAPALGLDELADLAFAAREAAARERDAAGRMVADSFREPARGFIRVP